MKKCPFCAEEIQEAAVKCKYCKSDIESGNEALKPLASSKQSLPRAKMSDKDKKILNVLGIIILCALGIWLWYLGLPALIIWYIWKKSKKLDKKKKILFTAVVSVLSIVMWVILVVVTAPKLEILAPKGDMEVQTDSIEIKGIAKPASAVVKINDKIISEIYFTGNEFTYRLSLTEDKNTILIEASNKGKVVSKTFVINRVLTEAEKTEKERLRAEAFIKNQAEVEAKNKAEQERITKEKAEQEAYDKSKAGVLCKKHTDWAKEDCQRIADKRIWVGMSLDMVKALRGTPNSASPSNYGGETTWQWCWYDYTPMCFYGGDDGIITSYN